MKKSVVTVEVGAAIFADSAHAWDGYGHMEVAAVPWEKLAGVRSAKLISAALR